MVEGLQPAVAPLRDRGRVILELLWVTLGVAILMEFLLAAGGLGFGGAIADLTAVQLMVLLLVQNLAAVGSILVFLRFQGPALGWRRRPVARELGLGLLLFIPVLPATWILMLLVRAFFPALHNVEVNPIMAMVQGPGDAVALLVASVLAGGVGEEFIRAFVLRRFETHLGGMAVGLVVWSVLFGALHLPQGADSALVVGLLGLVFGLIYAWRRSPVAPMVVHACFNAAQTLIAYLAFVNAP